MKKHKKNQFFIPAHPVHNPFEKQIAAGIERGETLEQLAERIDQENTPDFYGAEFRRAYSEGIEAGSAYGYEHPLDLHDAVKITMDFNNGQPVSVPAHLANCFLSDQDKMKLIQGNWNPEAPEHVQRDIATRNGFEDAEFEVVESNLFKTEISEAFQEATEAVNNFAEAYQAAFPVEEEPGEDLISTPFGVTMTVKEWNMYLLSLPEEERGQHE